MNNTNGLHQCAGENASLKPKGNFERCPHRRQLLTLAKVHGKSSDYYRAALMPVIRKVMERTEQ